jgi:hypothetical protein
MRGRAVSCFECYRRGLTFGPGLPAHRRGAHADAMSALSSLNSRTGLRRVRGRVHLIGPTLRAVASTFCRTQPACTILGRRPSAGAGAVVRWTDRESRKPALLTPTSPLGELARRGKPTRHADEIAHPLRTLPGDASVRLTGSILARHRGNPTPTSASGGGGF